MIGRDWIFDGRDEVLGVYGLGFIRRDLSWGWSVEI